MNSLLYTLYSVLYPVNSKLRTLISKLYLLNIILATIYDLHFTLNKLWFKLYTFLSLQSNCTNRYMLQVMFLLQFLINRHPINAVASIHYNIHTLVYTPCKCHHVFNKLNSSKRFNSLTDHWNLEIDKIISYVMISKLIFCTAHQMILKRRCKLFV